jgi:hypothetical protein
MRLWAIRVLEAELAFRIRLRKDGQPIPMRLTVGTCTDHLLHRKFSCNGFSNAGKFITS